MRDLLDFYQAEGLHSIAALPALSELKTRALADFERLGFPTRHDEAWKYSATDVLRTERYAAQTSAMTDWHRSSSDFPLTTLGKWPAGVIVLPWADAVITHAAIIAQYLGTIAVHTHGFLAQNTALFQEGLFIYVPSGVCLDEPLVMTHWQDQMQQARFTRTLVIAEPNSSMTMLEYYQGDEQTAYFTNALTEVYVGAGAHVTHYKIQRESPLAYHVGELAVLQAAGSQLNSHSLSLGGKWVRSDTTITLAAPHAKCLMNGIYAPTGRQHVDHHTLVQHDAPDCVSDQNYKGMVSGQARAVFNGKVVVAHGAQHSHATQQNKNLLLSTQAEIDTKPQLDIFADDVVCTHGATVGQLDEEALFYLGTRGISPLEASRYLVQAFVTDNLAHVALKPLACWMSDLIMQQVG